MAASGEKYGHQWGDMMAAVGEKQMAIDTSSNRNAFPKLAWDTGGGRVAPRRCGAVRTRE